MAKGRIFRFLVIVAILFAQFAGIGKVNKVYADTAGTALQYNGTSQYVTFGAAPGLGAATFTLETWFNWTGAGGTTNTGNGGLGTAIPLVTKGRGEAEGSNVDMNYFLGIQGGKLAADFEDMATGANHPVLGVTTITANTWHHAAATYDGRVWNLYLDGNLDKTVDLGSNIPPRQDSTQHAGLATAMTSAGAAAGFFAGALDEARIWNYARSQAEIQTGKTQEITAGPGLTARWGMNEGSGTVVGNSVVGGVNGTTVNGPTWVTGFPIPDTTPPAAPQNLAAVVPGAGSIQLSWTANTETDLAGYNLYRSTTSPVATTGTPLNGAALLTSPTYTDNLGCSSNPDPYYYAVVAVDSSNNKSAASNEASAVPGALPPGNCALQFNGSSQYVTFGAAPGLGAATFTLETWFNWTGGTGTSTGSGGLASAIPLITKGRAEADGSNVDMDYFLGIDSNSGKLAADFEDMASGLNHPINGATLISKNVWHHAAVTYDGTTWKLYMDGNLDGTLTVNQTPRYDSIQHAALATAMTSSGASAGYFAGWLDEARIWNYARTEQQIKSTINQELPSAVGLVGRWGLNEGGGTTVADSSGSGVNGTAINSPTWAPGALFNLPVDVTPPTAPAGLTATPGVGQIALSWTANSESDLAGYNVYRGTTSPVAKGTPLNDKLLTFPAYTDLTAQNGTTYFYAVSAVDSSGNESGLSDEVSAAPQLPPPGAYALDFGSGSAYVTLGDPAKLDLSTFTIETWFKRTGPGTANTTGSGGIAGAIPLVTHGAPEADGSNVDANWLLVIDNATGTIAADFEDMATGLNHPVYGTTPITNNVWHHAAATYDGTNWRLYLDGKLETTLAANAAPRADSIQKVGLGAMLKSDGTPLGHFQGALDEVRIWDTARTQTEIIANINNEIDNATGLMARYGFSEGYDGIVNDSVTTPPAANGTITGTSFAWVGGAPFNITFSPPTAPTGLTADAVSGSQVNLAWTDASNNEAHFVVERSTSGASGDFSPLATLPANTITFSDNGLAFATEYCYRVRALNPGGASAYSDVACGTTAQELNTGIALGANHAYISLGDNADLPQFTLETWLRRDGAGVATTTGTGGKDLIPLITNGTAEAETADADINYFFGIEGTTSVLCADFEEAQTGNTPGLNHPACGSTALVTGTWYHAAATYDGATWRLYLNGNLEKELLVGQPANAANISKLAFGTSMTTGDTSLGFFDGTLDEVRIWDHALPQAEIVANLNTAISTPQTGLVGRWSLNEGAGTTVSSSAGTAINGTITGTGSSWVAGAPFNISFTPPTAPTNLTAAAAGVSINLAWTDNANNESGFQIERSTSGSGGPFSLLTTVSANTAAFTDTGLAFSSEYCYRVRATNVSGDSDYTSVACATTGTEPAYGLDFGSGSAYVTFGNTSALGLPRFTLETWFKREGAGTTASTGSGGLTAIPLITKGMHESDGSSVDMNYFLGIDTTNVLAADFEDAATGANHPVKGVTLIQNNIWNHAAVTFDGTKWQLFLNGNLEAELAVGQSPRSDSIQHAGLGVAMNSNGGTEGHFDGVMDEVRIWNVARTQAEIQGTINAQITAAQSGLVARYGLNEGSGTTITSSAGTAITGTITGTGSTWVAGAPFDLAFNHAPNTPVLVSPANGATEVALDASLSVTATDPDNDPLTVTFYGRPVSSSNGPDFTLVALPDTQNYTTLAGGDATFNAQTQWVVDHQAGENIAFTTHLGDITEGGDTNTSDSQWVIADNAMSKLEKGTADPSDDVPFGLVVGNHDINGGTTHFENHFGVARFNGRSYYGGHYGTDNLNSYSVFSASGMNFLVLNLACTDTNTAPAAAVLDWADALLKSDLNRRGIVVCHTLYVTTSALSTAGQTIFNALSDNSNLFLMLGGHVPGVGQKALPGTDGHTINLLLSDYQNETNGGNGWLREMKFSPSANQIQVSTYSPTLKQNKTDADNQFNLAYTMEGSSFTQIGIASIASGETATVTWAGLNPAVQYEWYAVVSDGKASSNGATWNFTTNNNNTVPVVTGHPANQTVIAGQTATFSAAASGIPAPTVQWQSSPDGAVWTNITGATNPAYSFISQAADNGKQYRAVFTNSEGTATTDSALLTVTTSLIITTHPQSQTVNAGDLASFNAAAEGSPTPTVQWQVSTNGGTSWNDVVGATNATYSFTAQAVDDGNQYRAVFNNTVTSAASNAAVLTVNTKPVVSVQPVDQTVNAGSTTSFTAAATGSPTPTVQWQVNTGEGWSDITGAMSTTYSFFASASDNGNQYRALFTNTAGSVTSNAATLTVNAAPLITAQPANLSIDAGQTASFSASASGQPTPSVQWQVSTDGTLWSNISGATSTTYSFTAQVSDDGKHFRAIFTNLVGSAATNPAALTITSAPTITEEPVSQTVVSGQTASFTASASGSPTPSVQWQVSTNNGKAWKNISGATSNIYSFTVQTTDNGKQFRAVFTNLAGSAITKAAVLTVTGSAGSAPLITRQPVAQTVSAGQTATFNAAASGNPTPTVQWQVSTDGTTWNNIPGATSTTYSFTAQGSDNGKQYRAVFTNSSGSATSNAATLTVIASSAPVIEEQPISQTVAAGQTASFSASASGTPNPTVQWQVSTNAGKTWKNISGASSKTYSFTAKKMDNGKLFRAVFTNFAGTAQSDPATLTVQ